MPFPTQTNQAPSGWARTLNRAQVETVKRIRQSLSSAKRRTIGSDGWTVFMTPTVGTPTYLELRHYMGGGGIARWVIERDGSVSAHKRFGHLAQAGAVRRG